MPTELTPKWKPIPFPLPCAPTDAAIFDPVICSERAVLVAGGPLALTVFQVFSNRRPWFSVKAQVSITGFTVSSSSLYVQDGPVLSGWDLTLGGCFAAINLVTKRSWAIPADATPATQPPADLYTLPNAAAELQSTLQAARDAAAAASTDATLLTSANNALATATAAAASVVFSAPVVRSMQLEGLPGGQVFSLGLDGTVIALDDTLAHVSTYKYETPLRAELALSEVPQSGGSVLCRLHYITTTGEITSLDAMKTPLAPLPKWPSTGTPVPSKVLPLRFQDGLLWGGGVLGADFFATLPDPAQPLLLKVSAPSPTTGWQSYDLSPADKLVLVSNGTDTRLVSYDRSAKVRDRWRLRTSSTRGYPVFWPPFETEITPATPRLILEVDRAKPDQGAAAFRVLLSNTVDSPNPALASHYPPQATPLDAGTFAAGNFDTVAVIHSFASRPIVAQQTLYCAAWVQKSASSPEKSLALVPFALSTLQTEVSAKAKGALAELQILAQPIRLYITRTDEMGRPLRESESANGWVTTEPVRATRLTLALTSGNLDVTTDGGGFVELDSSLAGQDAGVAEWSVRSWRTYVECSRTTLRTGQQNTVDVRTREF